MHSTLSTDHTTILGPLAEHWLLVFLTSQCFCYGSRKTLCIWNTAQDILPHICPQQFHHTWRIATSQLACLSIADYFSLVRLRWMKQISSSSTCSCQLTYSGFDDKHQCGCIVLASVNARDIMVISHPPGHVPSAYPVCNLNWRKEWFLYASLTKHFP